MGLSPEHPTMIPVVLLNPLYQLLRLHPWGSSMFGFSAYSSADFRGSAPRGVGFWHVEHHEVCTADVTVDLV